MKITTPLSLVAVLGAFLFAANISAQTTKGEKVVQKLALHLLQAGFHHTCLMSRVTVHDQEDGSFPTMHQALEKLYERRR